MTGPLAQQFAQVRKNLDLITDEGHCTCGRVYTCDWCLEQEALDALSSIERHVQDMDLLVDAADRLSFEVQYFDDHPPEFCAMKRAALHLDGLLTSAGREVNRVAREKEEE